MRNKCSRLINILFFATLICSVTISCTVQSSGQPPPDSLDRFVSPEPQIENEPGSTLPAEKPPTALVEQLAATVESPTAVTEQPKITVAPPTTLPDSAADADVLFVSARQTTEGVWSFSVTVSHPDTGWEDYADGWDVVLPDGTVLLTNPDDLFTRLLLHPHENEQPFTRSQSNIQIPPHVTEVTVRAHDLVDGFGGQVVRVDLTVVSGPNFEVQK